MDVSPGFHRQSPGLL